MAGSTITALFGKDHQVVLLHMGGSSLINANSETELGEVLRITKNVAALIDSERPSPGTPLDQSRVAFQQICQKLRIHCHVLERRATENYLTDAAVKAVKGQKYRALGPYEALTAVPLRWGKAESWRIARVMSKADIMATDLGKFLDGL